jgi:integrase
MEQHLKIYRNHTPACVHGYRKPIWDGENAVPDCSCPLNAAGYLRHVVNQDGTPKRIQHRTLETKSWDEARQTVKNWLEWGNFSAPVADDDFLNRDDVTVQQAIEFFFSFGEKTHTKGDSANEKYEVLLNKRLKPWAEKKRKLFIRDFDKAVTVKQFFVSWKNLQPTRNRKMSVVADKDLATTTTRAELERWRTFLEFCKGNGWIKNNYAKKPFIVIGAARVAQKMAWTAEEYSNVLKTLDGWKDRYYKTNARAERLRAFCHTLRYTGQRISDVTMLGPENIVEESGMFFIALTQIKTGNYVKIPVKMELVDRLRKLPILGETKAPFVLERANYTITFGQKFWFWTAEIPEDADQKKRNQIVESAAKNWSDDVTAVLKMTERKFGSFTHHATPHTFRHFFSITMLQAGVPIETVSKWLGHSSPLITARHYSHANADFHANSHDLYMQALRKIDGKRGKVVVMRKAV